MLTGRPVIAISVSRSGTRSGAMSGSSSESGRECTPGTKKPVTVNRPITASPTSVRSRSLVPGPSASNGAPSFHRQPVTALPRRTDTGPIRNFLADGAQEFLELCLVSTEGQPDDVGPLLRLRQWLCFPALPVFV